MDRGLDRPVRYSPTFEPTAEREPFWFLGGQARILLPGAATGNTLALMEFSDPAGHAPPHHVHQTRKNSGSSLTAR